jgi:hypothetical protein
MLSVLCLLQVSAAVPSTQINIDSVTPRPSLIAVSSEGHFETFTAELPSPQSLLHETSPLGVASVVVDTPRTVAIEYSDGYYKRLAIHRYASYAMIPLFALEYATGSVLINHPDKHTWARSVHGPVAVGVAVLFGVNTVTGLWNLRDSRKDPHGRTRRTVHSLLMLVSDAGFALTGALAPGHNDQVAGSSRANLHRAVAISSGTVAMAGYLMMLIWKD